MEERAMTEEIETQENKKLPVLQGELALLVVVLINSLGVVLMLYSGSGISAISSVPYAFSEVFNKISLEPGPTFSRDFWYYP